MIRVLQGDCREVMATLADATFDACVTDPPYHLVSIYKRFANEARNGATVGKHAYGRHAKGFMGKTWDGGAVAFEPETWSKVLRVLKPGAHLIAFGGTRTYHRMACAIEDVGFEVRDAIMWHYGSGFPKSHDVSKGIDKAARAEREVVGIKPGHEEFANRATKGHIEFKNGTEGFDRPWMHDDAARERYHQQTAPATDAARQWAGWGTALKPATEIICLARKPLIGTVAANVLAHGTGALNIAGCRVEAGDGDYSHPGDLTKRPMGSHAWAEGSGTKVTQAPPNAIGRWPANVIHDGSDEVLAAFPEQSGGGTPERRAADKFRNTFGDFKGNETEEGIAGSFGNAARFFYSAKANAGDRLQSKHPTVKPVDLMAYLCRLITPPGGLVLDPFAGSGTTGMACMREGFDAILIEREAEYVADIRRRLQHVEGADTPLFASVAE